MRTVSWRLVFGFVVALTGNATFGANFVVAPSGNDAWPGTPGQPWRTLAHAAASVGPGDSVYIRTGTYNERFMPRISGTQSAPITFANYPGEEPVIDGTGIQFSTDDGLVDLSGQQSIRVTGLHVRNATGAAIYADAGSSLTIEHCHVDTAGGSGIGIWNARSITIDHNEIVAVCTLGWQEHLTVANTTDFEVMNNEVHGLAPGNDGKEGICIKDGAANGSVHDNHVHDIGHNGIYVDGSFRSVRNITVDANRVHDIAGNCLSIASEAGGLVESVVVTNNVGYGCQWAGIQISACCAADSARHPMKDVRIINNTFVKNGWPPWGGGLYVENTEIEGVIIRNNLLSDNLTFQLAADASLPSTKLVIDHNLIDGFRGTEGEVMGSDAVTGAALFVGATDFRLREGSPAIDRGAASGAPAVDFEDRARPQGSGIDIGAFERAIPQQPRRRAVKP